MALRFRLAQQGLLVATLGMALAACQSGNTPEEAAQQVSANKLVYPETRKDALVDTLHGLSLIHI